MQELPKNRLATTDEKGNRVFLYPSTVRGRFFDRKQWVHGFLVVLLLLLPWIRPNGQQLVLLDVAMREFYLFGLHFRAHDAPLMVFLLLAFAFLIGFVTAIWGRLWCGWACPQTVFTEFIFRRVERWIEGGPRERKELDDGPWTERKIAKKAFKWGAFLLISLVFTHSLLAYFVGSRELLLMISGPPAENWASFLVITVTTAILLLDFGWFREQFCVIACPYGRMQSVMLGPQSLVVGYDVKRGEPRRTLPPTLPQGDCVNCLRCVQVCPTGIDIRRGLQMECVACTACIDACDEVMTKTKKPLGLIRYMTLSDSQGDIMSKLNPRAMVYGFLFLAVTGALATVLSRKSFLEVTTLRARGAPYEMVQSEQGELIVNHFHLELSNQTGKEEIVTFSLAEPNAHTELVMPMNPLTLRDGAKARADFFLKIRKEHFSSSSRKIRLHQNSNSGARELEVTFVGPDS